MAAALLDISGGTERGGIRNILGILFALRNMVALSRHSGINGGADGMSDSNNGLRWRGMSRRKR